MFPKSKTSKRLCVFSWIISLYVCHKRKDRIKSRQVNELFYSFFFSVRIVYVSRLPFAVWCFLAEKKGFVQVWILDCIGRSWWKRSSSAGPPRHNVGFLPKNQTDWVTVTTIVHNIVRTLIQSGWFFSYPLFCSLLLMSFPYFLFLTNTRAKDNYNKKNQPLPISIHHQTESKGSPVFTNIAIWIRNTRYWVTISFTRASL